MPITGATHYHAQLGLPGKGRAIKSGSVLGINTTGVWTEKARLSSP